MLSLYPLSKVPISSLDTPAIVIGTLTQVEADDTVSAAGEVLIVGTLTQTEENDVISASGGLITIGSLDLVEDNDILITFDIIGVLAVTEGNDALSALGHANQPPPQPQPIIGLEWQTWDRAFEPKRSYI